MKCLNPDCDSLEADELNVSCNISETAVSPERGYTGSTEMGNTSNTVGTTCPTCEMTFYVHDWEKVMIGWLKPPDRNEFVAVLPEPRWCWLHYEQGETVHADYTDKWAFKWDQTALMCQEHAVAHALKGEPIILWEEASGA